VQKPTDDSNVYHSNDEDLHSMMQRLFDEGNESIEVQHPDGVRIITRQQFADMKATLERNKKASPAKKFKMRKQIDRLITQKQIRHRTAMITAKVHVIDVENGKFGCDIDGNDLDVAGMVFTPTDSYLDGVELVENEVGCFIDEDGNKAPVRVKHANVQLPVGGVDNTHK